MRRRGGQKHGVHGEHGGLSDGGAAARRRAGTATSEAHAGDRGDGSDTEQPFWTTFSERCTWLVSLAIMQSLSSLILAEHSVLLQQHAAITLFLTMLVGAGGNAGNQSTVNIIRSLALGQLSDRRKKFCVLRREAALGILLGVVMAVVGFVRVVLFYPHQGAAVAISLALFFICATATVVGTCLPLGFHFVGVDPVHAGPAIQVAMDIIGVTLTCSICSLVFRLLEVPPDGMSQPA
eukprot:m.480501 g.480501  ORF g.480501 m.480501 type:complete len:236 (+) comp21858_c0_seq1:120-827(+)